MDAVAKNEHMLVETEIELPQILGVNSVLVGWYFFELFKKKRVKKRISNRRTKAERQTKKAKQNIAMSPGEAQSLPKKTKKLLQTQCPLKMSQDWFGSEQPVLSPHSIFRFFWGKKLYPCCNTILRILQSQGLYSSDHQVHEGKPPFCLEINLCLWGSTFTCRRKNTSKGNLK